MSKVTRSPSETEANWKTEEDDMTEGDLGYGLGGRPGGIYEVSCSSPSKKRSDGRNLSPPPFPRKGAERSETVFQYSGTEGLWDTCPHGCRATGYGRQSSAGENSSAACSPSSPGGDYQCSHSPGTRKSVTQEIFISISLRLFRLNLLIYGGGVSTCQGMPQLEASSFLPPCGSQGPNSRHQAW